MHSAAKIAALYQQRQADAKDGQKTGQRDGVGLFIPLPESLAQKFPSLGDEDKSPAHVTFLYIGEVPEDQEQKFLTALSEAFQGKGWPQVRGKLDYLDYFQHADKERNVAHMAVKFSHPMAELRERVKNHLENAGIDVGDSFPIYRPHTTLEYMDGLNSTFKGEPVQGEWDFDTIEVWGLPKVHKINFARGKAAAEKIPGGLAKGKKPSDFDSKQIAKGIKVELEHTDDKAVAREIAMDHLTEDPAYYTKLETIEKHAFVAEDGWNVAGSHRFILWPDNANEESFLNGPVRSLFERSGYTTGRVGDSKQPELGLGIEFLAQRVAAAHLADAGSGTTISEALEITAGGLALLVVQGVIVTNAFFGASEIRKYLKVRRRFHPLFAPAALQVADFFEQEAKLKAVAMGLRMFANANPQQTSRALAGAGRALQSLRRVNYPEIDPAVRGRLGLTYSALRAVERLLHDKEIEAHDFRSAYENLFENLVKMKSIPSPLRSLFRQMAKMLPNNLPEEANPGAWFDMASEEKVGIRARTKALLQEQDEVFKTIEDPQERLKAYREVAQKLSDIQGEAGVNLNVIESGDEPPLDDALKQEKKLVRDGPTEYVLSNVVKQLQEIQGKGYRKLTKRDLRSLLTRLSKAKTFATMERVLKEAMDRELIGQDWVDAFSKKIAEAQRNKALKSGLPLTPIVFEPKTAEQFQAEHDTGEVEFIGEWTPEEKQNVLGRVSTAVGTLEGIFGKGFCGKHAKKLKFQFQTGTGGLARASYFGWDNKNSWQPRVKFGPDFDGVLAHELSHYLDDLLSYKAAKATGLQPDHEYGDVGHGSGDIFGNTGQSLKYWLSKVDKALEREPTKFTAAIHEFPEFVELMQVVAATPDYERWEDKLGQLELYVDGAVKNVTGKYPWDDESLKGYAMGKVQYRSELPPEILEEAIRMFTADRGGDTRKLNYWNSGVEVWARLCEQYVYNRLSKAGIANPWLTQLTYDIDVEDAFVEDERFEQQIEPIMDRLFARLKERQMLARLRAAKMNDSWLELPEDVLYRADDEDDDESTAMNDPYGDEDAGNAFAASLVGKVASLYLDASTHRRSISLMKFLSDTTRRLGVAQHVYVVGGAVRNFVIDKPIKDIDVVIDSVSAGRNSDWYAKELARQIPAATDITTNQYGVAILTVKGDWELEGENMKGEVIEIANARSESYAKGEGYKPTDVQPATIQQDMYRREFTFNTLMWRLLDLAKGPDKAEIIDLTGCGLKDLQEGTLKCPSDPDKTFSDDPSRMLRAIKFTGKYGFKIPKDVAASIKRNAKKMKRMPWEAIGKILVENVLNEPSARKSLKQMKELGLLDVVSEMIQEQKPFATYMSNQLRKNRKVSLLLDLMDLGVPASTPLHFLTPAQRKVVRALTSTMPEDQAAAFADRLIKPPVNNKEVIDTLMLPGPQRRNIQPLARDLILADPSLAENPRKLTEMVIKRWK